MHKLYVVLFLIGVIYRTQYTTHPRKLRLEDYADQYMPARVVYSGELRLSKLGN